MRSLPQFLVKVLLLAGSFLLAALAMHLFVFSASADTNDPDHRRDFNDSYRIFSLTLPQEMTFCGEEVPLGKIDVRERLDRELLVNTYWQSNSLLAHKRAARWFPIIEPILEKNGIPDDLKYIALVESGFANVVSPVGAAGFWQFMKNTAPGMGLEVGDEVDERYNVVKATEAACKYLKQNHAKYGSWAMAAASYNLGPGGVDRQVGRQRLTNYFDLLLPEETSRYVFRILAMKEIIGDPERYGFHLRKQDLYPVYDVRETVVDGPIPDLADFAFAHNTDYKTIKLLNPWLRDTKLTNRKGKRYVVLLPGPDFDKAISDD